AEPADRAAHPARLAPRDVARRGPELTFFSTTMARARLADLASPHRARPPCRGPAHDEPRGPAHRGPGAWRRSCTTTSMRRAPAPRRAMQPALQAPVFPATVTVDAGDAGLTGDLTVPPGA